MAKTPFFDRYRTVAEFGRYGVTVTTGSYCRFDRQKRNGLHSHEYYEICLVLKGEGEFLHGGNRYPIMGGDVFLAEPDIRHEIVGSEAKVLELVFVNLEIRDSRTRVTLDYRDEAAHAFLDSRNLVAPRQEHLEGYLQLLRSSALDERLVESNLVQFAVELMLVLSNRPDSKRVKSEFTEPILEKAFRYMRDHVREKYTSEDLAKACGVSGRQLRRLFQEHVGRTIRDSINDLKMNHAVHQLLMRYSVGEVARQFGMDEPGQFSRMFKKYRGESPKSFQQRHAPGFLVKVTKR